MGDSGSQLLGFIMGVLAILLTDSTRGPFSPALALLLLGLPFLDTLGGSLDNGWRKDDLPLLAIAHISTIS